ncbi:hypothetical protein QWZ10_24530 [Paracoccus cavernae]|uniref:Uncharacterized protein n=1 Tax=Paracoccus cavernae TaxID=1571207 RepID=A0ABT8DBK1_9RHOB|nr:hypothetical protein [Paracoccus cavernae]
MSKQANGAAHELGWRKIAGSTPRETGRALGAAGRDAVHKHLPSSEYFQLITGEAHAEAVARMAEQTRLRFPKIWEEIEGLAEGSNSRSSKPSPGTAAAICWRARRTAAPRS